MAVLPIIKLGHPSLRKKAEPVTSFDDGLRTLAANMIDTMRANDGIGLAGPQVNVLKRIFVIDVSLLVEGEEAQAFINPEIVTRDGSGDMEEGCLSIPGISAEVTRPDTISVRYQTLDGEEVEEELDDLFARVYQHELDHLNGVLFIDHLPTLQRKLLDPKLKKIREDYALS